MALKHTLHIPELRPNTSDALSSITPQQIQIAEDERHLHIP
jgi:hypothetical protein